MTKKQSIIQKLRDLHPICAYQVNIGLMHLEDTIHEQYKVDMDPEYQRSYVWSDMQKQKFVGAFLENHKAIPPFWFNWVSKDFKHSHSEIVDGKQRLSACIGWVNGDFEAICPSGIKVHFDDLDEIDRISLSNYYSMEWCFVDLSRKEVMEFYIRLNSGGTIHSDDELERVKGLIKES
jgi:hypothetical protein